MPLLGFSVFKEKLLDGSKTQTIRRPRKHPIKVGDKLFIYWKLRTKECEKLGDGIVTNVERKQLCNLTHEEMWKDGFKNWDELINWFSNHYGVGYTFMEFDVIQWKWIVKK